jgi:hypothetical protein
MVMVTLRAGILLVAAYVISGFIFPGHSLVAV